MKILKLIFIFIFLSIVGLFLAGTFWGWDKMEERAKGMVKKMTGFIYHEATIHNPEGDMIPDEIDDKVKGKIKDTYHNLKTE